MREWEKERRIILKNLKEFMEKWRIIGEAVAWGTIVLANILGESREKIIERLLDP